MIGPYYVNTEARRRAAWGPPCDVTFGSVVIDGRTFKVERRVVQAFQIWEIVRAHHQYHLEGTDTGFYNCRHMRHNPALPWSTHAWAAALDVNWLENPAGSRLITNMPKLMIAQLQQIRTKSGAYVFMWGGDWDRNPRTGHTYYDAMHWEVIAHPLDLATGFAQVVPQPAPIGDEYVIKVPDRGPKVAALQRNLNIWQPALDLLDDGIYGENTANAVKRYQEAAGLPATGVVDAMTASYINTIPLRMPK